MTASLVGKRSQPDAEPTATQEEVAACGRALKNHQGLMACKQGADSLICASPATSHVHEGARLTRVGRGGAGRTGRGEAISANALERHVMQHDAL